MRLPLRKRCARSSARDYPDDRDEQRRRKRCGVIAGVAMLAGDPRDFPRRERRFSRRINAFNDAPTRSPPRNCRGREKRDSRAVSLRVFRERRKWKRRHNGIARRQNERAHNARLHIHARARARVPARKVYECESRERVCGCVPAVYSHSSCCCLVTGGETEGRPQQKVAERELTVSHTLGSL